MVLLSGELRHESRKHVHVVDVHRISPTRRGFKFHGPVPCCFRVCLFLILSLPPGAIHLNEPWIAFLPFRFVLVISLSVLFVVCLLVLIFTFPTRLAPSFAHSLGKAKICPRLFNPAPDTFLKQQSLLRSHEIVFSVAV